MTTQGKSTSLTNSQFQALKAALHRANEALAATLEAKGVYLQSAERWKKTRDEYLATLTANK